MREIGSIDGPTYLALLHEHASLKAENERLRKTGQHCGCVSSEDGESIVESCMFHAKQQAENERLREMNKHLVNSDSVKCLQDAERYRCLLDYMGVQFDNGNYFYVDWRDNCSLTEAIDAVREGRNE